MKGRVLIIAGSDSGGGAGIQADIKAVSAMGAYAATAITAVTVQNTLGVTGVHDIPTAIIREQIEAVLSDIGADAIKIGMIGRRDAGEAILAALEPWPDLPLVVDPVLVATSGDALGGDGVAVFLRDKLIPRATVVTPNLPELAALTGSGGQSPDDIQHAAEQLLDVGAGAVLAKGGHGEDDTLTDRLFTAGGVRSFSHPKIDTTSTHGTGCTLASALAAGLAQGMALEAATERAINYVQVAIAAAPGFGGGHGPLNHLARHDGNVG